MQERRNIQNLRVAQRHRRHPLIRPSLPYHWSDLVALHVVRHQRRAHQVRPARSGSIRAMAKSAGLHELFAPALRRSRNVRTALLRRRRIPLAGQQNEPCANQYFLYSPFRTQSTLIHSPPDRHVFYPSSPTLSIRNRSISNTEQLNDQFCPASSLFFSSFAVHLLYFLF